MGMGTAPLMLDWSPQIKISAHIEKFSLFKKEITQDKFSYQIAVE